MKSGLYLLAGPLGNLGDITSRAVEILKAAGLVLAEDTRRSLKLLNHLGLKIPLLSYRAENHQAVWPRILRALEEGLVLALLTDAGSPSISDPGALLVSAVREKGFMVFPVPGPSAVTAALMASGFPADRFSFLGFLPAKKNERRKFMEKIKSVPITLVFFEAPHRLAASVADLAEILGPRQAFLAREMTKVHEEYLCAPLDVLKEDLSANPRKGEITLVVEGASPKEGRAERAFSDEDILAMAAGEKGPTKLRAAELAQKTGRSRGDVYRLLLTLKEK